jgi:dienelactone hydrolase
MGVGSVKPTSAFRSKWSVARWRGLLAAAGAASLSTVQAFAPVEPTPGPELRLQWQPAPVAGRRPVVVALHGCGGLYTSRGAMDNRYIEYAARWNAAGWHVLLPDSFSARGKTSTCREPSAERSVTVAMRRRDVNAALQWLQSQADVDPRRVALVGWSNGGSTVLRTIHRPEWPLVPVAAVALYPSCAGPQRDERYTATVPLLLLVGALDDWTPPQPCEDLARRQARSTSAVAIQFVNYADSYHGFDSASPVRTLKDIPSGVDGRTVRVGGNSAARADALMRIDQFLRQHLD